MMDGQYVFFTIQHRRTHEGKWLELDSPLKEVKDKDRWTFSSFDVFGKAFNPYHGKGNKYRPRNKKASDQIHDVWACTGYQGWWDMDLAVSALIRVNSADEKGEFDSFDTYGKRHQRVRHEFRVVKVRISRQVTEATIGDAMACVT